MPIKETRKEERGKASPAARWSSLGHRVQGDDRLRGACNSDDYFT
jgi:hypothetical protein